MPEVDDTKHCSPQLAKLYEEGGGALCPDCGNRDNKRRCNVSKLVSGQYPNCYYKPPAPDPLDTRPRAGGLIGDTHRQ